MANRDYITVEELNFYINNIFLSEELLHNVPVVGEVSGCSVVGGHCYFTLKDPKAQIKVCLFNCAGKYVPQNGEKVLVRGSVDYFIKGGTINVKAYEVKYFGVGLLNVKFQELKDKLEKEGLFREDYKKDLPVLPKRIAIITSIKGAAVQDFITTVRKENTYTDITIIDVRVQGEYCVQDVITALNNADNEFYDLIIIARGGGSYEDLFCFNDENLVRTIFNMNTPVVSAVGHETDYTLCDFVADYRAITPTAAGELIAGTAKNAKQKISDLVENLSDEANDLVKLNVSNFIDICEELKSNVDYLLQKEYSKIKNSLDIAKLQQNAIFERNQADINKNLTILEQLNPLKLLNVGYFRILKEDKYVYKTAELQKNDKIKIMGVDGEIDAIVERGGNDGLRK